MDSSRDFDETALINENLKNHYKIVIFSSKNSAMQGKPSCTDLFFNTLTEKNANDTEQISIISEKKMAAFLGLSFHEITRNIIDKKINYSITQYSPLTDLNASHLEEVACCIIITDNKNIDDLERAYELSTKVSSLKNCPIISITGDSSTGKLNTDKEQIWRNIDLKIREYEESRSKKTLPEYPPDQKEKVNIPDLVSATQPGEIKKASFIDRFFSILASKPIEEFEELDSHKRSPSQRKNINDD